MAPSSWTTARQLATPGAIAVATATCSGPQVNPSTSVGVSRRINSAAAARPTLANAAGRPGAPTSTPCPATTASVRPKRCSSSRSSSACRSSRDVRRHDDLDANQSVGLGAGDEPSCGRPGDPEPGGDLGLGQSVEVVEGRGAKRQTAGLRAGSRGPERCGRDAPRPSVIDHAPIDLALTLLTVSICSGVRVDAHHASMVNVTHTTLSPDARMRAAVLVEPGRIEMEDGPCRTPAAG